MSKMFNVGAAGRLQANLDLYNVLNANSILGRLNTLGPRWGQPISILPGRMLQLGARWTF
jgi:hypothetical protein